MIAAIYARTFERERTSISFSGVVTTYRELGALKFSAFWSHPKETRPVVFSGEGEGT
jgi:hypothetical protein